MNTLGVQNSSGQSASTSKSYSLASNKAVSKDEFLKLLTYQLKSQDPMKPYDNQEFAAQLAQFSQLEQLTDIRSLMEQQISSNNIISQNIANSALPGLLGKSANATTDQLKFNGNDSVPFGFVLPMQASNGEITIKDLNGIVVKSFSLSSSDLLVGSHKLQWDGKNSEGVTLPVGTFTFNVNAKDSSGNAITAEKFTYGTIEAVRFKTEGTMLVLNGIEIPLSDVTDISTSGI